MHHRKAQSLKNVGITLLVLRINPTHCCFFVTLCNKTSTTRTHSNSASLLNGSLLAKEFVFSKTVGLQQATLLNNDLLHNYFSRSLTIISHFAEHLLEFVSMIIDIHLLSQWALNLRNRRLKV